MKIRIKILFGYLLLAVMVAVVGLVGYRATHVVGTSFNQAINQTQPVLQALQDIRFQTVSLQGEAHHAVHRVEPEAGKDAGRFAELDAALRRYRDLVAAFFPGEADEAAEIEEKVEQFKAAIARLDAGVMPHSEADKRLGELSVAVAQVLEATEEAAAGELREFAAYQAGVNEQIATQEWSIVIVALVALLGAILGGSNISRRVAQPVIALRDAVRTLGSGRLDTRVAIIDSTEVGELATAFNSMAEQLSGSMVSRDYLDDIIDSMAEGLLVLDAEGRVVRVNRAFRTLYRCADDYVFAGHRAGDFLPNGKALEAALGSSEARHWIETEMRTADDEMLAVTLSLASLHSKNSGAVVLVQNITERKRNEERLSYLAHYDALTGLPNRNLLLEHLAQSLSRQPWKKERTAVLFCDLDRFKFVNDTLGHDIGDVLLQRVAERLRACVRPGDIVSRWSGDEFVVLLNDVAHAADVGPLAEKVVEHLRQPVQIGAHELYVTVSVGVSISSADCGRADELVKCADMAMYAAKAEGKNTCCFYAEGMAEQSQERLQLERALRRALLDGGQLQVHYQAQQLLDGPIIGFEALVRWQHPELGLIAPASFLPTAEEAGLMAAIDESVLRMSCEQARHWQQAGIDGLRIAVNVSDHLFRRGDLPDLLDSVLAEYGLPASAIEIELTEAIVMSDVERSIATMHRLRDLGVELSIDDFGTGYSSLAHLKRCPIQMLKIDRSFVKDVMTDPNDAAITEAIVALAHKMGILVIAEGVETEEQLAALKLYGCDAMQGYLLSKPIPVNMLSAFLDRVGYPRVPVDGDA